ncbi:MAG: DEAD/DEAH box helicase family protein [Cyanothece sp. SIO1E1]|nr:DEAD/DEAH box helicase family protein [Cyanothece sp. SIO1E1]
MAYSITTPIAKVPAADAHQLSDRTSNNQPTPLTGLLALKQFLQTLQPKGDNYEIWLKLGQDRMYVGQWDETGEFDLWASKLEDRGNPNSRIRTHKITTVELRQMSETREGGVFYLPGQPIGMPLKKCVTTADDIGIEFDKGTQDEQWQAFQLFSQITGLDFSSILSSGGKSLHGHIKLADHLPIAEVVYLRRLTTIAMMSDPAVTNPHQPMRIPGFYRLEKGKEQGLYSWSDSRYTCDEILTGLQRWFDHRGWVMPESITDDWWRVLKRFINSSDYEGLQQELAKGADGFETEQNKVRQQRQQRQQRRVNLGFVGNSNLVELVNQTCDRLGPDGFDWPGHDWKHSGSHPRGYCPWHESTTGTAGWVSNKGYHCPTCTDNRPLDAFWYDYHLKHGINAAAPTGKAYVDAAKEFLQQHGVQVPEWKPGPRQEAKRGKTALEKKIARQNRARAEELEYYQTFCAELGIAPRNTEIREIRKQINQAFFERYVLQAERIEGDFSALPSIATGQRRLDVLEGQKGTKKTQGAIAALMQELQSLMTGKGLIFCPTRLLARSTTARLRQLGINARCHLDADVDQADIIVCCPESAHRFAGQRFDYVVIDEPNEVIEHVLSGKLGNQPDASYRAFKGFLAHAQRVVIAQDELHTAIVREVQRLGQFTSEQTFVTARKRKPTPMAINLFVDRNGDGGDRFDGVAGKPQKNIAFGQWMKRLHAEAQAGRNIAVPIGSQAKARDIHRFLRRRRC